MEKKGGGRMENGFVYDEEKTEKAALGMNEAKKTVYLLGDSNCMGYREYVRKALAGKANVVFPEENGRCCQYMLLMLRTWSGLCDPDNVAVVQFNTGHWDIAHWNDEEISLTSVEDYCKYILRIAEALKRMYRNAKIVFATTMPMNPNGENSINSRTTKEIMVYNEAVKKALAGKVLIHDLFETVKDYGEERFLDYCHLTEEANEEVGKKIAEFIEKLL